MNKVKIFKNATALSYDKIEQLLAEAGTPLSRSTLAGRARAKNSKLLSDVDTKTLMRYISESEEYTHVFENIRDTLELCNHLMSLAPTTVEDIPDDIEPVVKEADPLDDDSFEDDLSDDDFEDSFEEDFGDEIDDDEVIEEEEVIDDEPVEEVTDEEEVEPVSNKKPSLLDEAFSDDWDSDLDDDEPVEELDTGTGDAWGNLSNSSSGANNSASLGDAFENGAEDTDVFDSDEARI